MEAGEGSGSDPADRIGWLAARSNNGKPPALQTRNEAKCRHRAGPSRRRCAHGHLEVGSEGCGAGGEEMSMKYAVIFERAENNWAAYVPDLPGCISTGRTLEETERNIREAISGHLQTLLEFGEPVPQPTSVAREIEVTPAGGSVRRVPALNYRQLPC